MTQYTDEQMKTLTEKMVPLDHIRIIYDPEVNTLIWMTQMLRKISHTLPVTALVVEIKEDALNDC